MTDRADTAFRINWTGDHNLYTAVMHHARMLLRRVPGMTDQTLGRNIRDAVQRWCVDEEAEPLGWQETAYTIDPEVLARMREEVRRAGGFSDVSEDNIGREIRDLMGEDI